MEFKRIHMTDRPMDWEDAEKRIATLEREKAELSERLADARVALGIEVAKRVRLTGELKVQYIARGKLEQDCDRLQRKVERLRESVREAQQDSMKEAYKDATVELLKGEADAFMKENIELENAVKGLRAQVAYLNDKSAPGALEKWEALAAERKEEGKCPHRYLHGGARWDRCSDCGKRLAAKRTTEDEELLRKMGPQKSNPIDMLERIGAERTTKEKLMTIKNTIDLPLDLHTKLRDYAMEERLSMGKAVLAILQEFFDKRTTEGDMASEKGNP